MSVPNDWERVRHQVAILGYVVNEQTEESMQDISVTITAGPSEFMERLSLLRDLYGEERWERMKERPDQTRTAHDGSFYFLDLPAGDYTLRASSPGNSRRFGSKEETATVSQNEDGIVLDRVSFEIPATTLTGQVTSAADDSGDSIQMAEVRLVGSGERTFSDGAGNYSLVGIEHGERKVVVEAVSYQSMTATVTIETAGDIETHDFSLSPENLAE